MTSPGDVNHQADIDAAIARVELLRPDLDRACDAFQAAVVDWVPAWWNEEARRAIADRPFVATEDLKTDGIKALKRGITELVETVPSLVRLHLDDAELWVHRRSLGDLLERAEQGPLAFVTDYVVRQLGVQPIEDRLRLILGPIAGLLLDAKLVTRFVVTDPEMRRGRWRREGEGGPARYMGPLDVPHEVRRPLVEYSDRARDLHAAVADVVTAQHGKAQFLAEQMWDEA